MHPLGPCWCPNSDEVFVRVAGVVMAEPYELQVESDGSLSRTAISLRFDLPNRLQH
jgi:hypothetical protein